MQTHEERQKRVRLAILAVAAAALLATPAAAQAYDEDEDAGSAECVPDCRTGYLCRQGTCVSRCNPPCEGDEVCTREGECIPRHPPPVVMVQPAPTVYVVPSHQAGATSQRHQLPDPTFDIDEARRKKAGGGVVMGFGIMGLVAAGGFGVVYAISGNAEFALIGLAVEMLALTMFIPGLVAYVKNKKRIEQHERRSRMAFGLAPLAMKDGGGLALAMSL